MEIREHPQMREGYDSNLYRIRTDSVDVTIELEGVEPGVLEKIRQFLEEANPDVKIETKGSSPPEPRKRLLPEGPCVVYAEFIDDD
jgi:hypothetical protein